MQSIWRIHDSGKVIRGAASADHLSEILKAGSYSETLLLDVFRARATMFIFNVTSGENWVVATPKAPWISHLL